MGLNDINICLRLHLHFYTMCASSKGCDKTVQVCLVFASSICDKYQNHICWPIYNNSHVVRKPAFVACEQSRCRTASDEDRRSNQILCLINNMQ